jgi:hypothetical protein
VVGGVFVGGERSVGRCRMNETRRGSMTCRGATTMVDLCE